MILHHNYQHYLPFFQTLIIKSSVASGILLASLIYYFRRDLLNKFTNNLKPLYLMSFNKWYIDELYNIIFVKPLHFLAFYFWNRGDKKIIDAYGPNGISQLISIFSKQLSLFQSGYLYHYAFVMLGGLAIILTWFVYY